MLLFSIFQIFFCLMLKINSFYGLTTITLSNGNVGNSTLYLAHGFLSLTGIKIIGLNH